MPVDTEKSKRLEKYGQSKDGNFKVIDTIGVPHPYCIGTKHVVHAADHHGGILDRTAIESAERAGAKCDICKGKLSFAEHETALLVGCLIEIKDESGKAVPELHEYLLQCKPLCEADGFAGFAFKRGF